MCAINVTYGNKSCNHEHRLSTDSDAKTLDFKHKLRPLNGGEGRPEAREVSAEESSRKRMQGQDNSVNTGQELLFFLQQLSNLQHYLFQLVIFRCFVTSVKEPVRVCVFSYI